MAENASLEALRAVKAAPNSIESHRFPVLHLRTDSSASRSPSADDLRNSRASSAEGSTTSSRFRNRSMLLHWTRDRAATVAPVRSLRNHLSPNKLGKRLSKSLSSNPLILAAYIVIGMAIYESNERSPMPISGRWWVNSTWNATSDQPPPEQPTEQLRWTYLDAVYFAVVTVSTVGYGDFSPLSDAHASGGMMFFTIMYVVVGIVFIWPTFAGAVEKVSRPAFHSVAKLVDNLLPPKQIDINESGEPDFVVPQRALIFYGRSLAAPFVCFIVLQIVCAAVFVAIEDDVNGDYGKALYHCLITATTVGYGDVSIRTDDGKIFAVVHILLSVSLLAAILTNVDELRSKRRTQLKHGKMFLDRINVKNILSLDTDGLGVDRFEFVVGMLIRVDAVDPKFVLSLLAQFQALDVDGDGRLMRGELEAYAEKQQQKTKDSPELQAMVRTLEEMDLGAEDDHESYVTSAGRMSMSAGFSVASLMTGRRRMTRDSSTNVDGASRCV